MRNNGYTRPLSVLKIRSDVRSKYARMSRKKMVAMLTPIGKTKMFIKVRDGTYYSQPLQMGKY